MATWTAERLANLHDAHASKAYKLTHSNFSVFCQEVFGVNKSVAYALLSGKRNIKQQIQPELRWEIWERDDFRCFYCGTRRFLSIDHKIPESKGGSLDKTNLLTACVRCNSARGQRDFETFLDDILFQENHS